jgi:hypothetical protein
MPEWRCAERGAHTHLQQSKMLLAHEAKYSQGPHIRGRKMSRFPCELTFTFLTFKPLIFEKNPMYYELKRQSRAKASKGINSYSH